MGLDFGYATKISRQEGVALIRVAHERGATFFDTAEVYGPFTNEQKVGEELRLSATRSLSLPSLVSTSWTASNPTWTAAPNISGRFATPH
jgi:aryl-alcohol dehydrogenase-like predicted oxidoreductase